ncbi:hypothetical protein Vafri_4060, partial [Volvox africanus]
EEAPRSTSIASLPAPFAAQDHHYFGTQRGVHAAECLKGEPISTGALGPCVSLQQPSCGLGIQQSIQNPSILVEAAALAPPVINHGPPAGSVPVRGEESAAAVTAMPLDGTETTVMHQMCQVSVSTGALLAEYHTKPQVADRDPSMQADMFTAGSHQEPEVSAATVTPGRGAAGTAGPEDPKPMQEPPVDTQQQGLEGAMLACRISADYGTAVDDREVQMCITRQEDNNEYLNRQEDNTMAIDTHIVQPAQPMDQPQPETVIIMETQATAETTAAQASFDSSTQSLPSGLAGIDNLPSTNKQPAINRATGSLKGPAVKDVLGESKALVELVAKLIFHTQETGGDDGQGPQPADGSNVRQLVGLQLLDQWGSELDNLRNRCKLPNITIGVVGNTGAGKSSLLNVLLGEEDILPTNGMRASTGCPIEVGFAPSNMYRAEVEFMTKVSRTLSSAQNNSKARVRAACMPSFRHGVPWLDAEAAVSRFCLILIGLPCNGLLASFDRVRGWVVTVCRNHQQFLPAPEVEWERCLEHLLSDLRDEDGGIKINDSRCEAGAAQAMLEAVYGRDVIRKGPLSFETFKDYSSSVTNLLGTTKVIRHSKSDKFRREIGEYVDSHNKAGDAQPWPIVKVCRIQHNWKLLSGGAVLVDLPGVRDANEARGAVAEEYMKNLRAVADITRAVDDKTAKDLLGTTFKRQLVLDGQLNALTFVCTKRTTSR